MARPTRARRIRGRWLSLLLLALSLLPAAARAPAPARAQSATGSPFELLWSSPEVFPTSSVAWGDVDSDGDLDLAVGNYERPNQLYRNDGGQLVLAWESLPEAEGGGFDRTYSVAWGDYDLDGDLDLMAGNGCDIFNDSFSPQGQPNRLYENEGGQLTQSAALVLPERDCTTSVAWGDIDNDGRPDLAVGNGAVLREPFGFANTVIPVGEADRIYHNQRGPDGEPRLVQVWQSTPDLRVSDPTQSVAWGDLNGDGRLDLAVGNLGLPVALCQQYALGARYCGDVSRVYVNTTPPGQGAQAAFTPAWAAPERSIAFSVAWADADGNGLLDLAVGNANLTTPLFAIPNVPNRLYLNQGGVLTMDSTWSPGRLTPGEAEQVTTLSMAWADYDSDGDPDLATGVVGAAGASIVGGLNQIFANSGAGLANLPIWEAAETDDTYAVAWGDVDGDGRPDVVAGNGGILFKEGISGQPNRLYRNRIAPIETAPSWTAASDDPAVGLALGDIDGDDDLDLVLANLAEGDPAAPTYPPSRLYLNEGGVFILDQGWQPERSPAVAVALGDVDGDGDLDLVLANRCDARSPACRSLQLYRNSGAGLESLPVWASEERDTVAGVAWADVDSDGDLDLAAVLPGLPARLYLNQGGRLELDTTWQPPPSNALGLAWADIDSDSDLDLAIGNDCTSADATCHSVQLYLNEAGRLSAAPGFAIANADRTTALAWGDVDGDGDLDLATGNAGQPSRLYRNCTLRQAGDGCGSRAALLGPTPIWSSVNADITLSIAWGDMDGDGDLDLAVGNLGFEAGSVTPQADRIYLNLDGALSEQAIWSASDRSLTSGIAWGDLDGDGALDLLAAGKLIQLDVQGEGPALRLYRNRRLHPRNQENLPLVRVSQPEAVPPIRGVSFYGTSPILASSEVTFTYTLTHPRAAQVRHVRAEFSLNGGGAWHEAIPAARTRTVDLATSAAGTRHSFVWDLFQSGVMGLSDNVVFRLIAIPDNRPQPPYANRTPERFIYGASSAATLPFRLRGTQVRVLDEGGAPVENAIVYRLRPGESQGGQQLSDTLGRPFRTDALGYLQGRSTVAPGDRLVALAPISATETFTVYHTSAAPTREGLSLSPVSAAGVQELRVSAAHPLVLFNLDLSLEWDARNDKAYLAQLDTALQRASELLYDLSEGQAALGTLTLYHGRERWDTAHIRVYATNRLRPSAVKGGVVTSVITDPLSLRATDPLTPGLTYEPGQVRMGSVWNRYGDANGELADDWARTLAHELGHFSLFLDDNYLGLSPGGQLIGVDSCRGMMADPYVDDNTELHPAIGWAAACGQTLSNQATRIVRDDGSLVAEGRSDWETLVAFYPWLRAPQAAFDGLNEGPASFPLAATQVVEATPAIGPAPPAAQATLAVLLRHSDGSRYQASSGARAILFQGERLIDLGRPTLDQIAVRGSVPGDRLCLYDPSNEHQGCLGITGGSQALTVEPAAGWQPDIVVTPVTSRTVTVSVLGVEPGLQLRARLYPTNSGSASSQVHALEGAPPSATITLDQPSFEGYVHVWLEGAAGGREAIADYLLGGNPGRKWAGFAPRGSPGRKWAGFAPVLSADGQVIIYDRGVVFDEGAFVAVQSATKIPQAPSWTVPLGKAYRLTASPGAPDLTSAAINISYFERDVPAGTEGGIAIYYLDERATELRWQRLETELNQLRNEASAQLRGRGLYVLMTAPRIDQGWNLLAYPWPATRSVAEALRLINGDGAYTTVYGYEARSDDPWRVYDVAAPPWVNDLEPATGQQGPALEYGRGYWVLATAGALRASSLAQSESEPPLPNPPATFYATLPADIGAQVGAGAEVRAQIGAVVCGRAVTRELDGQLVFSVDVAAAAAGQLRGCGVPGAPVSFTVGGITFAQSWPWRSGRPTRIDPALSAPTPALVYLPLLR